MSLRYLFPCSNCEHQFELVATQAGQELTCPGCQQPVIAPRLGKLKQLPPADGEAAPTKSEKPKTNNLLFSGGLALAIICGICGVALYMYGNSMITDFDVNEKIAEFDKWVDNLSPAEVVSYYYYVDVESGLGDWREQDLTKKNTQGTILKNTALGICGLAVVGLLLVIGSFFAKPKSPQS